LDRLIIWDWNGTLLNDVDACIRAMNMLLEKRKMPKINLESYRNLFSFPVIDCYKTIGFDFERENFEVLAKEYIGYYQKTTSGTALLQEGAAEILEQFKSQGRRQIILSAMETAALKKQIEDHGLFGFFDEILGADNIHAHGKIETAKNYLSQIGNASSVSLIGDTYHDYEVAAALGCRCILVKNGHQNLDRFHFRPETLVKNSLSELAASKIADDARMSQHG